MIAMHLFNLFFHLSSLGLLIYQTFHSSDIFFILQNISSLLLILLREEDNCEIDERMSLDEYIWRDEDGIRVRDEEGVWGTIPVTSMISADILIFSGIV